MLNQSLFRHFAGDSFEYKTMPKGITPDPGTDSYVFLEKGHAMEYILAGPNYKKIVSLFFGPGEFVIKSHPRYSKVIILDDATMVPFKYSMVIRTLRKFPETKVHYHELRNRYFEKVANRLRDLQTMTGPERFHLLKKTQPWVFSLAQEEDIASFLGISIGTLCSLR